MNLVPIQTEQGYQKAIARLEYLFPVASPGTPDGDEYEQLEAAITDWEKGSGLDKMIQEEIREVRAARIERRSRMTR